MIHGARSRRRTLLTIFIMVACGTILGAALAAAPAGAIRTNEQYGFMNQIGGPGTGVGQFGGGSNPGPYGVAVDAAGNVFVVDPSNSGDRIHKFTPGGTHVCSFAPYGTTANQLGSPFGIAVAPDGTVYAVDTWRTADNNRIRKFVPNGSTYVSAGYIATPQISHPANGTDAAAAYFMAVDGAGNVYVTNRYTNAGTGTYIAQVEKYDTAGNHVTTIGSYGSGAGQLSGASGVAVSPDGKDVYVANSGGQNVKRFHSDDGSTYAQAQVFDGTSAGEPFLWSLGVAVDGAGNVYGIDNSRDRIVKFDSSGNVVSAWGSTGAGDYQSQGGWGIAVSSSGCVYLSDPGSGGGPNNHRVMRYARDLTPPVSIVNGLPAGWTNAAVVGLTFSGTDPVVTDRFTSGYDATELFLYGGWTGFGGVYEVTSEGITTLGYRAGDVRGNLEAAQQLQVRIDRTRPSIDNPHAGVPAGWSKTPVTVKFLASDALSLVARTEYSTDGGATWTTAGSATVSRNGTTTLLYRAVDNAGNVSDSVTDTIKVDRIKPSSKPLADVTVKRGKTAKLRYRITDSACPQATAVIKIKKGSKVVKIISLGKKATGRDLVYSWKCSLAKGAYTWTVLATDLAGNKQAKTVTKKLTVK